MELPLGPADLHVLLALSRQPMHGLEIAEDIANVTHDAVTLGPATLYRTLKELLEQRYIGKTVSPEDGTDPRRKYYAITPEGTKVLRHQINVATLVAKAGRKRLRSLTVRPGLVS